MSAHVVNLQTINAIVSWAEKRDLLERMGVSNADELGQILHDENVRSVNHRYNENKPPDTYKHETADEQQMTAEGVESLMSSLNYQSCETPDWSQTRASECLAVIECDFIGNFPGIKITLHEARHPMVVEALVAKGKDVNEILPALVDSYQNPPLHWARSPEVAQALIDAGADVSGVNKRGETPLHVLATFKDGEVLEVLLKNGADPSACDAFGNTPLHSTATYGNVFAASVLVKAGADPLAANMQGETPLSKAQERKVVQTINVMERAVLANQTMSLAEKGAEEADGGSLEELAGQIPVPSPDTRSVPRAVANEGGSDSLDDEAPMKVPSPDAKPRARSTSQGAGLVQDNDRYASAVRRL